MKRRMQPRQLKSLVETGQLQPFEPTSAHLEREVERDLRGRTRSDRERDVRLTNVRLGPSTGCAGREKA